MLNGLQSNQTWGDLDFDLIRPRLDLPPQFQSALLMYFHGCKHDEDDIDNLRGVGITHFTMRLGETIYEPDENHGTPWLRDPVGYANDCLYLIRRFYQAGVRDFVLGPNEANIYYHGTDMTPEKHADYLQVVIDHLNGFEGPQHNKKPRLPEGVRVGFPPIAWNDNYPYMPWLTALKRVGYHFGFCSVHTYWQSSREGQTNILQGPLTWSQFGANYKWYQGAYPMLPIQINEWGNSIHEQGMWSHVQVQQFRMEQYPLWLALAAQAGIEAAHVFISEGSTHDWQGFQINPALAAVMAQAPIANLPSLHNQSRRMGSDRGAA